MNAQDFETAGKDTAEFQRIWAETVSKTMQAAFTFTPNSPPPEMLRQIRAGIFEALSTSWDQFLRSPQFLEATKQWMEQAVAFRKMTTEWMGNVRHEMQAPSREDTDSIMLAVRHMEKRLLDRIEQLAQRLDQVKREQSPRHAGKQNRPAGAGKSRTGRHDGRQKG